MTLTCQELTQLVSDYLDQTLAVETHSRIEQHLQFCTSCRNHVGQMRQTLVLLHYRGNAPLPPQTVRELLHQFKLWEQEA